MCKTCHGDWREYGNWNIIRMINISLHIRKLPPATGSGGVLRSSQNSNYQDLPKFQFFGGGVLWSSQNSKCQDLPKFQFSGGGGEFSDLKFQRGVFWRIWTQIYCAYTETCLCITDSLSHTMCVETNKIGAIWLHYARIHSKFILDLRHCSNRSKGRGVMSHYFHGNLLCFAGTT